MRGRKGRLERMHNRTVRGRAQPAVRAADDAHRAPACQRSGLASAAGSALWD